MRSMDLAQEFYSMLQKEMEAVDLKVKHTTMQPLWGEAQGLSLTSITMGGLLIMLALIVLKLI